MRRPVTVGAVLAGGRSTRMGTAKATVELAGRTLAERVVAAVGSAGLEPLVVAKPDSELPRLSCRVLAEPSEPRHPLTGILAALDASAGRGVVAIACDMPFVPARLIAWLAGLDEELVVCRVGGRLEPLLGRYSPAAAVQLQAALTDGAAIRDAVAELDPRVVDEGELESFGNPERIVFNINSPADLRRAEEILGGAERRFVRSRVRPARS